MAEIRRIGHDHYTPFQVVLVLVGENQAVTRGENKLPHDYYTSDPQDFYKFWTPYKTTNRGADKRCPQPPNPPYGGGANRFAGAYDWLIILTPI